MANFLNYIIESSIQPVKTNVLWIKNGVPYYFNKKWKPLLGEGSGGGTTTAFPIIMGEHYNSALLRDSNNKAFGESSVALGKGVTTNNIGEAAFGLFNKSVESLDPSKATLFTIGNGTSNIFKNVFEVRYDGSIYIEGLDVSIQEYLRLLNAEDSRIESKITESIKDLDGKIQEYSTSIIQNAKKIELIAEKTTIIENKTIENESRITQTAENITSEVSRIESKYDGELNTVKGTVTSIDQKADKINLRVDSVNLVTNGLQTQVTENKSAINQTKSSIELLVEENKTFSDRIEKAEADIKINTDNIALNVKKTEFDLLASKVEENVASININTNNIESKVSKESFNVYTGEVDNRFTTVNQTIEGVTTTVRDNTGKITEVETSVKGLSVKTGTLEADVESLKKQADGSIDTYFGNETPTLDNEPAVNWSEEDKRQHTGDIYYNNSTGEAFRFSYDSTNNFYFWNKITDSALIEALESISKLEGSIDGKSTTYVKDITDSSEKYKLGDLWILPIDLGVYKKGTLLTCVKDFNLIFNWTDWEELIKYTDDSALDSFVVSYNETIGTIKNQVDKKAETWYQNTDPSIDWTTNELKSLHIGDLWFDTKDQKTYYWNGNSWEFQNIPIEVFDTIDSKSSIFIEKPTNGYNIGDLWILETDYELLEGIHKIGTWVVAIRNCEVVNDKFSWNKNDWVKKDRYTDDTALHLFEESYKVDIQNIKTQIDGKAQTWYQSEDPSLNWSEEEKIEHKGDLWYNTDYNTTWYWDGVKWEYQNVPKEIFDNIDGKSSIYVEKPSSYHINDLWVLEKDYILNEIAYKKGTWVVATESSDIWNPNHWIKKDSYTDDSGVIELNNYIDGAFSDNILEEGEKNIIKESKKTFDNKFNEITSEYSQLLLSAFATNSEYKDNLTIVYEALKNAKDALDEAIDNILAHTLDSEIKLEDLKEEYDSKYVNFVKSLQDYRTTVEQLKESINVELNSANVYISDIASDSIITSIEKKQLSNIWQTISKEFDANKGIAVNYKIIDEDGDYTTLYDESYYQIYKEYEDSYKSLVTIFQIFDLTNLNNSTILPEGYSISETNTKLDVYYTKLQAFSELISKITIEITDAHDKAIAIANSWQEHLHPNDETTQIGKGLVLSTVIGVQSDGILEAALNASDDIPGTTNENHGRIIFAGGIGGSEDWNDATTIIYEDGYVKFVYGEIGESINLGGAILQSVVSGQIDLLSYPENGKLIPLFQVNKDENGKIVSISSLFDLNVNGNLAAIGEVSAGGRAEEGEGGGEGIDFDALQWYLDQNGYVTENEIENLIPDNIATKDDVDSKIDLALESYATLNDVDRKISDLVDGAPTALDTLKEIADALENNEDSIGAILTTLDSLGKQDATHTSAIQELQKNGLQQRDDIQTLQGRADDHDEAIEALDGRVTNNATEIENMAILREWYRTVGAFIGKDEHGIYTDENFRSSKEISAGGAAEEGEEGEGGITTGEYKMYHHTQGIAAKEWRVEHGLGKYPNVRIVDSNKMLCYGDVKYVNDSVLTITFGAAEKGDAYCD